MPASSGETAYDANLCNIIVRHSLDGVLVLEASDDAGEDADDGEREPPVFTCRIANERAAQVLGCTREQLQDERIYETQPLAKALRPASLQVLETGEPHQSEMHFERGPAGGWFDVNVVRWQEGVVVSLREATGRRRKEEQLEDLREDRKALREARQEVESILESITDAFFAVDDAWRFTYLNDRAEVVLERHREELLGRSIWEEFPEAVGTTFYDEYHRALREQVSVEFEEWYPPLECWFKVRAYPRAEGGLSVFFNDVTERKQREQELRKAKKQAEAASNAKSTFLASMSHELRTPLNKVIGYSEMFIHDPDAWDEDYLQTSMQRIHEAGHQLLEYVEAILHASKDDADQQSSTMRRFALPALVEEVAAEVRPAMDANDNDFRIEVGPDAETVWSDETKVRQILSNLLVNAAQYTRAGTVTLSMHLHEQEEASRALPQRDPSEETPPGSVACELVLEVRDTGTGLTDEEQERLFDAFERGDADTGGIGLGLSITHDLCALLGGRVEVESEKDVGSTFTVRLPVRRFPREAE